VFAVTQVSTLQRHALTWRGFGRAMLVLALIWWAWSACVWVSAAFRLRLLGEVSWPKLAAAAACLVIAATGGPIASWALAALVAGVVAVLVATRRRASANPFS